MPGFAGLPSEPKPSIAAWVKAVAEYIKDNRLQKPILIGHSLGGVMALKLASEYPDLISKVIVLDALPCLAALINPAFKIQDRPD